MSFLTTNEIIKKITGSNEEITKQLELLKKEGFKLNINNYDSIIKHLTDKVIINTNNFSEKQKLILNKIGYLPLIIDDESCLFTNECLDTFGIDTISRIYKYIYLPYNTSNRQYESKCIDFNKIFQKDNLKHFIKLYNTILNNKLDEIEPQKFHNILNTYQKNFELINNIIKEEQLSKKTIENLNTYFNMPNDVKREISLKTEKDIEEIDNIFIKLIDDKVNI